MEPWVHHVCIWFVGFAMGFVVSVVGVIIAWTDDQR